MRTIVIASLVALATSAPAVAQSNAAFVMQSGGFNNALIQQSIAAPAFAVPATRVVVPAPEVAVKPEPKKKKKAPVVAHRSYSSADREGRPTSDGHRD